MFFLNVREITEATCFSGLLLHLELAHSLIFQFKNILYLFPQFFFTLWLEVKYLRLWSCGRSCGCGCGQDFQPQIGLRDLLYFFHRKKVFSFFFLIMFFFSSKNWHIFSTKKMFFFLQIFFSLQKVTKSCSKTIAHICFSLPPFGRGGRIFFWWKKIVSKPWRISLKRTYGACPTGGGL